MPARKKTGSTIAKRKTNTAIANIQEQLAKEAENISEQVGSTSTNAISMKDKVFTLPSGEVITGAIQLVIVDFVCMNKLYEGKYNAGNPTPPICFAINRIQKQLAPNGNSPDVQTDGDCAECPMFAWGSDGDGKACKEGRRLAVLPIDATPEDQIMTLNVPPTAIQGFDAYVKQVAKLFASPPVGVITTIDFHPEKDYPLPIFGNAVPNPEIAAYFGRRADAEESLVVEPDYSGTATTEPKRKVARKKVARKRA